MDILTKITDLREKRHWTVWRLAEESGVDQSTISAWYNKGRCPSIVSLERICEAFGITMAQFFIEGPAVVDLTREQAELLETWSALSQNQKEVILSLIKNILTGIS
jgi:transcriptional regulator with XRE-family HTH domain